MSDDAIISPRSPVRGVWALRVLLALAFAFGGEILIWPDPFERDMVEWLIAFVGYVTVATFALDLAARYRIRDVYGVMNVVLVSALLLGFLVHPARALVDFPDHLVTRVVGATGIVTLEGFGLFLALIGGSVGRYRRNLWGFSFALGFYGALWARHGHTLESWSSQEPSLASVALMAGALIAMMVALAGWVERRPEVVAAPDLRLSQKGLAILALILASLLFLRIAQSVYVGWDILIALGLMTLAWAVLYFERGDRGRSLLDRHLPPRPMPLPWLIVAVLLFAAGLIFGWQLELFDYAGYSPLSLVEIGFLIAGFAWVPLTLLVSASRALNRQSRRIEVL